MSEVKQVILIRKDLKMGKGKIASQASHACMSVFFNSLTWGSKNAIAFLDFIYDQKTFALSRKYDMYIRWKTQITNQ